MAFFHWMAGVCVGVLLVAAAPQIVHQATSDEGDGWSGASPGSEIITLSSFGGYYYEQYGLGMPQIEALFSFRSNTDADPDNNYDNAYFGELLSFYAVPIR